jgi:MFS family permease
MRKEPLLYAISFAIDTGFGVVGIAVPLFALHLGATYDELGLIGAVSFLVYSLGSIVSGRLSERLGYRHTMIVASVFAVPILILFNFTSTVIQILLLSGVIRLSLAGLWPPMQAWLGRGKDGSELLKTLGKYNVCWGLGIFVGPLVGGALYGVGTNTPFISVAILMGLISLLLITLRVHDRKGEELPKDPTQRQSYARRFLPIALTANFAGFFSAGAVRALFPKLTSDLGMSSDTLGILLSLIGVAQVIVFILVTRNSRWEFKFGPLATMQILAAFGLLFLVFGDTTIAFAISMLLLGAALGTTFTASIFYSLLSGGGGRRTGIHESIIGGGYFLGPLVGGIAAQHVGSRAPYVIAAAVMLIVVLFQTYLYRGISKSNLSCQPGN